MKSLKKKKEKNCKENRINLLLELVNLFPYFSNSCLSFWVYRGFLNFFMAVLLIVLFVFACKEECVYMDI